MLGRALAMEWLLYIGKAVLFGKISIFSLLCSYITRTSMKCRPVRHEGAHFRCL